MRKIVFQKISPFILLLTFIAAPVFAQVNPISGQPSEIPEFVTPARPEPQLLPQEILDEFEGGMTIEEFLVRNQGPIPNALLDYATIPVTVVVQLDKPSLIAYMNQEGWDSRSRTGDQSAYIAELESDQAALLGQIIAARGAEVTQIGAGFNKTLNGFMLQVPANAINEIRQMPGVKSVTRAPEHELNLGASVPLIGADDVWMDLGVTGEGITIAVIDTGIDYTHAMLGGSGDPADYATNNPNIIEPGTFPTEKVIGGYDFAGSNYNASDPANSIPVPDDDPLDEHRHGTHVAATAAGLDIGFGSGVAPDALLYALKVFGRSGSTNLVLHAIEWAMDPQGLGYLSEPVDVINMSLASNWGPADETDPEYLAIENATSIGVVVVAAAGNAGNVAYNVGSPSTTDSAISVAASTTGYTTDPPDSLAFFSSRGPRGFDSKLKPEITAPGMSILAADIGTGVEGIRLSGTSMAAPHIAGVAALLSEAHPDWDTVYIKAAMMNTALDLVGTESGVVPRQGAGRVDAYAAITTDVVAYADPKLVSLSWGVIEVFDTYSDTQTITLKNFSDTDIKLSVDTVFTTPWPTAGTTLTPAIATVTVPAYGVASVDVTLDLDATLLPLVFGELEEYYGFVNFREVSNPTAEYLRVPFYFVPRPFTEITEIEPVTRFEVNDWGYAILEQEGPLPSSLWFYPVTLVSPYNQDVMDMADLRFVGIDYAWFDETYGDVFSTAFAMWGGVHINQPFFSEIYLYVDTSEKSVVNFNFNFGGALAAREGKNDWGILQFDFNTEKFRLGSPFAIHTDFNSGLQVWSLPAEWQNVVDVFEYEVFSYDYNMNFDYGGEGQFDITRPSIGMGLTSYFPDNEQFLFEFWLNDWWAYNFAKIQGVMLMDYRGQPGAGQAYYWPIDPYFATFLPVFGR